MNTGVIARISGKGQKRHLTTMAITLVKCLITGWGIKKTKKTFFSGKGENRQKNNIYVFWSYYFHYPISP